MTDEALLAALLDAAGVHMMHLPENLRLRAAVLRRMAAGRHEPPGPPAPETETEVEG